ncbi:MAG TPA: hypothetical protein VE422_44665 [Terriglobia bacterium]|nr:hypothetical protein [Terriglobia bacterium]
MASFICVSPRRKAEVKVWGIPVAASTELYPVVHAFKRKLSDGTVNITVSDGVQLDPAGNCGGIH